MWLHFGLWHIFLLGVLLFSPCLTLSLYSFSSLEEARKRRRVSGYQATGYDYTTSKVPEKPLPHADEPTLATMTSRPLEPVPEEEEDVGVFCDFTALALSDTVAVPKMRSEALLMGGTMKCLSILNVMTEPDPLTL